MKVSCCRQYARLLLLMLMGLPVTQYASDYTSRSSAGATAADIQGKVDAFIGDLGGSPSLANTVHTLNMDVVTRDFSSPYGLPLDYFSIASPQGLRFGTSGQGVQVSAPDCGDCNLPMRFGNLNPTYPSSFQTYQSERLLAPIGSTSMDVYFTVPGSLSSPASVRGFGVVFSDVDIANSTTIELYDQNDHLLYANSAPVSSGGLSFLGVTFLDSDRVARAHLTLGNSLLGNTDGGTQDVVTLAGLFFGDPQPVPEVEPFKLILLGMGAMAFMHWRRKSQA
jgi:hypothetical protein